MEMMLSIHWRMTHGLSVSHNKSLNQKKHTKFLIVFVILLFYCPFFLKRNVLFENVFFKTIGNIVLLSLIWIVFFFFDMNKRKKEKEKNGTEKRKETNTTERNMEDKQRVWRKHEGRKKRERKIQKQKMVSKKWSTWKIQQRRRKGSFCSKKRNKRTDWKRGKSFVVGERKMMNEKEDPK